MIWRLYWIAIVNGVEYPQFLSTGERFEWKDLPEKPDKIVLRTFSPELASAATAKGFVAEVISVLPITINISGVVPSRDEIYAVKRAAQCKLCGSVFGNEIEEELKCPQCGTKNGWSCPVCNVIAGPQTEPKPRCLNCKASGHTVGLVEDQNFRLGSIPMFGLEYLARFRSSNEIVLRVNEKGITIDDHTQTGYVTG